MPRSDLAGPIPTEILKIFDKYLLRKAPVHLICSVAMGADVTFTLIQDKG